jgi:CO dehydrogenase nickel-insertion accessory protein CooC1
MTITIALAGKGGVGKTTVAGMVIKWLAQNQPESILAIDADPISTWCSGSISNGRWATSARIC